MADSTGTIWPIEPHTEAKHAILRSYLGAWFPILATAHKRILYIDGFAGPGEYEGGEDGSPIIALEVARDHVLGSKLQRPGMDLVFIFIERDEARCNNLKQKLAKLQLPSNFKIRTKCDSFEHAFGGVLTEIEEQSKRLAPSFVFIDPFGPTGFPMHLIERIAKQPRSEVLITFNYQALNQWFLQDALKHKHIDALYGDDAWRPALGIADSDKREAFLRETYRNVLESLGWKVCSFQMINKHNQTQYYLFFATSHSLGMLEMKRAMWGAAPTGDFQYSDLTNPQQACLFDQLYDEEYAQDLAEGLYEKYSKEAISKHALLYDYVAWHPICIKRHLTRALRILEYESSPPRIAEVQWPGDKSRKKGTYPEDCTIRFAP